MNMLPDRNTKCPYTGFSKSCFEGVTEHQCPKWVHVMGANPQTGEHIDKFACSDSIMHLLMIENSQMQRQTGAAVESFRNEMLRLNASAPRLPFGHEYTSIKIEGPK